MWGLNEVKDVHDWVEVKRLHMRGVKIKQIAKQLKISKNTVKSLLKKQEAPKYHRSIYPTKIDKYKEQIKTWYLDPKYDFIGTRIYEELKNIGYLGSISPIYRYLNSLNDEKRKISSKATVRFETIVGDQAQFDWSPYKIVINREIKEVYCFSMILSASRQKSIVFSLTCNQEAIFEAIQELFEDLGGVTKELLIDNPKALVTSHKTGEEPKFNISALVLATHLGTELNPCNPYRARTKGKVERPFQYIEEHFIKGNSFDSMEEINSKGKIFIKNWCKKVHGTTKRIPEEFHREELKSLLPLPQKRFLANKMNKRLVSLDSLISIDGKKYSVPIKYVGKEVVYRIIYGYRLEVYDKGSNIIIGTHEVGSNRRITRLDEHYEEIVSKVPKSIPEAKRQFLQSFEKGKDFLYKADMVLEHSGYHIRQILKLKELYTCESLDKILEYCVNHNIYRIEEIKELLKERYLDIVLNEKSEDIVLKDNSQLIRDLSYYEEGVNFECKSRD